MFAGRVPASLAPGPWARRLARLRADGRPLLDLTDYDPTTAGLVEPGPGLRSALADPAGWVHAPSPRGQARAREAVAAHYAAQPYAPRGRTPITTANAAQLYATGCASCPPT